MRILSKAKQKGFSLPELAILMAVGAVALVAVVQGLLFFSKNSVREKDKSYATQKAMQMMEELRGIAESDTGVSGRLDDFDDGATYNPVLTTLGVTDPTDPLSGNPRGRYARRVSVLPMPGDNLSRRVYVRVYLNSSKEPLAEILGMLSSVRKTYPPTQEMDVYFLALENVNSIWTMSTPMRPTVNGLIQDIQTRNPGLRIRTHWITTLSYGRDPLYTPDINWSETAENYNTPSAYFYPGYLRVTPTNEDPRNMYDPTAPIQGRHRVDNGALVPGLYPLADNFNHSMRYPDEWATYQSLLAAQPATEPSLRLLLDDMIEQPQNYRNAMLINLHGELLPVPPVRNYSDAAKQPDTRRYQRAVTHPENIRYGLNTAVNLRVYTYASNITAHDAAVAGGAPNATDVTLILPNINTGQVQSVLRMDGDAATPYGWRNAAAGTEVDVQPAPLGGGVMITLKNSPLRHPPNGNQGVSVAHRLYNLEYVPALLGNPSPMEFVNDVNPAPSANFDLEDTDAVHAKNTARWIIRLNGYSSSTRQTVVTRLGTNNSTSGYPNESRTYFWVGSPDYPNHLPFTEDHQFLGDPRHMPYADVRERGRYNWFFRSVNDATWGNFTDTRDGFGGWAPRWGIRQNRHVIIDVGRYYQFYRHALSKTGSVYSNISGWAAYHLAMGGEIGGQGNPSNMPRYRRRLWDPTAGANALATAHELFDETWMDFAEDRLIALHNNAGGLNWPSWMGLTWIGELYPDDWYDDPSNTNDWVGRGNLPTGPSRFYRARYRADPVRLGGNPDAVDPATQLTHTVDRRTGFWSTTAFFNGNATGNDTTYMVQDFASGSQPRTPAAAALSDVFKFPMPMNMPVERPFLLDDSGSTWGNGPPAGWTAAPYRNERTTLYNLETYYDTNSPSSGFVGTAILKASDRTAGLAFYSVINGVAQQSQIGSINMIKIALISTLQSLLKAGEPGVPDVGTRVVQVPRVLITSPSGDQVYPNPASPSAISISWLTAWARWDGQKYTTSYPNGFAETVGVVYNVMYSRDGGASWFYAENTASTPAPVNQLGRVNTGRNVSTPFSWDISDAVLFPKGRYIVRVEAHRANQALHYAYHQQEIYIDR